MVTGHCRKKVKPVTGRQGCDVRITINAMIVQA
jgi:hypothetical protein